MAYLGTDKTAGGETCGLVMFVGSYASISVPPWNLKVIRPSAWTGYRVDNGEPELFVKLGEGIQFLHLKHKRSNGFCLGFPFSLCGAELLKLCLGFFVPLHKPIVPGGVLLMVLRRLRILCNAAFCQFGHNLDLLKQGLDFLINTRAVRQRSLHQSAILKDVVFAFDDSVKGGHEPRFNGFLVQMRRFAFVLALEFAVALPDDPAVF